MDFPFISAGTGADSSIVLRGAEKTSHPRDYSLQSVDVRLVLVPDEGVSRSKVNVSGALRVKYPCSRKEEDDEGLMSGDVTVDLSVDGAFEAANLAGKFKSNCAGSEMTLTADAGKVFLSSPSNVVGSVYGSGTAAAVSIDKANVLFSYAEGGALRASIEGVTDVRSLGVGTFHDSKQEAQISGSFSLERGDFKLGGVRGVLRRVPRGPPPANPALEQSLAACDP